MGKLAFYWMACVTFLSVAGTGVAVEEKIWVGAQGSTNCASPLCRDAGQGCRDPLPDSSSMDLCEVFERYCSNCKS